MIKNTNGVSCNIHTILPVLLGLLLLLHLHIEPVCTAGGGRGIAVTAKGGKGKNVVRPHDPNESNGSWSVVLVVIVPVAQMFLMVAVCFALRYCYLHYCPWMRWLCCCCRRNAKKKVQRNNAAAQTDQKSTCIGGKGKKSNAAKPTSSKQSKSAKAKANGKVNASASCNNLDGIEMTTLANNSGGIWHTNVGKANGNSQSTSNTRCYPPYPVFKSQPRARRQQSTAMPPAPPPLSFKPSSCHMQHYNTINGPVMHNECLHNRATNGSSFWLSRADVDAISITDLTAVAASTSNSSNKQLPSANGYISNSAHTMAHRDAHVHNSTRPHQQPNVIRANNHYNNNNFNGSVNNFGNHHQVSCIVHHPPPSPPLLSMPLKGHPEIYNSRVLSTLPDGPSPTHPETAVAYSQRPYHRPLQRSNALYTNNNDTVPAEFAVAPGSLGPLDSDDVIIDVLDDEVELEEIDDCDIGDHLQPCSDYEADEGDADSDTPAANFYVSGKAPCLIHNPPLTPGQQQQQQQQHQHQRRSTSANAVNYQHEQARQYLNMNSR